MRPIFIVNDFVPIGGSPQTPPALKESWSRLAGRGQPGLRSTLGQPGLPEGMRITRAVAMVLAANNDVNCENSVQPVYSAVLPITSIPDVIFSQWYLSFYQLKPFFSMLPIFLTRAPVFLQAHRSCASSSQSPTDCGGKGGRMPFSQFLGQIDFQFRFSQQMSGKSPRIVYSRH